MAELTRYVIEKQDGLGIGWEPQMSYSSYEHAMKAWPIFRRETRKPMRIVREVREIVFRDSPLGGGNAD